MAISSLTTLPSSGPTYRLGGLTVKEAAHELGYQETSLRTLIHKGRVRVERIGRHLRVFREDNSQLWAEREALGLTRSNNSARAREEG